MFFILKIIPNFSLYEEKGMYVYEIKINKPSYSSFMLLNSFTC